MVRNFVLLKPSVEKNSLFSMVVKRHNLREQYFNATISSIFFQAFTVHLGPLPRQPLAFSHPYREPLPLRYSLQTRYNVNDTVFSTLSGPSSRSFYVQFPSCGQPNRAPDLHKCPAYLSPLPLRDPDIFFNSVIS